LTEDIRKEATHETTFKNIRINDETTELEIFWALMPLKLEDLLKIVRDGTDKANCKLVWDANHINTALCVIFDGAQFKDMTDLWSMYKKKGDDASP
jgi:hypothetical protein